MVNRGERKRERKEETKAFSLRAQTSVVDRIEELARVEGRTMSNMAIRLITEALAARAS